MLNIKVIIGLLAILVTIAGYYSYIRDVVNGKTKPHIYSWFLFGFITLIAFALQVKGEGGFGCFATLMSSILVFTVFFLSLRMKGNRDITRFDTVFLIMTIVSLSLWLVAKQPVLSVVLITVTDLLAYGPTIRKAWFKPHTETVSFFALNTVRFLLILASLDTYSIMTALYPVAEAIMQISMVTMLQVRRNLYAQTLS
ncbi:MAG: hypothetical protein NUV52_02575 [Candidatus Roizmanbacteria bacterium]|nr:hypothetical protein [Candidatus Roizmanbacteria bacterium]